jgi:hypothetical protein
MYDIQLDKGIFLKKNIDSFFHRLKVCSEVGVMG